MRVTEIADILCTWLGAPGEIQTFYRRHQILLFANAYPVRRRKSVLLWFTLR
jgi:hypothetical protein